jgi:predicted RNase H-like HicB family nuclease
MGKLAYTVVTEWDREEDLFIATIPALSVATYGATRGDAMEKAHEAAQVTVEGLRAIGQPVPIEEEGTVGVVELAV